MMCLDHLSENCILQVRLSLRLLEIKTHFLYLVVQLSKES